MPDTSGCGERENCCSICVFACGHQILSLYLNSCYHLLFELCFIICINIFLKYYIIYYDLIYHYLIVFKNLYININIQTYLNMEVVF
jgi:hypothetical protein